MEEDGEAFFCQMMDTRNIKAQAESRGKSMGVVTKSYGYKAMKKIMYAREERLTKRQEKLETEAEAKLKREEDAKWKPDPTTEKHEKRKKAKEAKTEEKVRKKMEKMTLSKTESLASGHKHKPKH